MHTKETGIFLALLIGLAVLLFLIAAFIMIIVRFQRDKIAYDRSAIRKQLRFLEQEKERISNDLHDDLGALMASLKMRLQMVVASGPGMQEKFVQIEQEVQSIMNKMRGISHNMMPTILKRKGLSEAVKDLFQFMLADSDIEVGFKAGAFRADPDVEVQLYRIIQEMLNNSLRHSCAKTISIELKQENGRIYLRFADDGMGFDKDKLSKETRGAGLRNIMSRVAIINAKIYLSTKPGHGVEYHLNCCAYVSFKKNQGTYSR